MQSKASTSTARGLLVLVLAVCLVECVTEQRINNRGSKASNLVQKVNGWRSQRGGSCLSYGHSCWGAHGKRSGQPAAAPDWYLSRVLRRLAANNELQNLGKQLGIQTDDDIYRVGDDTPSSGRFNSQRDATDSAREPEAKPMLDDDVISKMKLWQIMRAGAEEQ